MAYTVDQLCARASTITGLSDAAGSDDRALLDLFVNEEIVSVFEDTECTVTKLTQNLTPGTDEYQLSTAIIKVMNYAQSSTAPSSRITVMNSTEIIERKYLQSTGTVRYFSVLGGNLLIVSPSPDIAATLTLYVIAVPATVATTQDIFAITLLPQYAQRALEAYVYARAFETSHDYQASRSRGGGSVNTGSAAYWDAVYEEECGNVRKTARRMNGRTWASGRIGYPDGWLAGVPSRNDVYPNQV